MNFLSPIFLCAIAVLFAAWRRIPQKARPAVLLVVSWLLYTASMPWAVVLLAGVTLLSYATARLLEGATGPARKALLMFYILILVFLMAAFKYHLLQGTSAWPIPPGISFYAFQTLGYVLDVYHGKQRAETSLWRFALFVAFFPQLVAGPIERYDSLAPQLFDLPEASEEDKRQGVALMLRGFARKVLLADSLAPVVDRVFALGVAAPAPAILIALVLFSWQIYGDFAGYTDIARGTARVLGIRLMENFDHPYEAVGIRDFWRRWHLSLTTWLRDYVYIPLGGSRKGRLRTALNTLIVFLLSGIWHGQGGTFAVWGLLHGLLVAGARLIEPRKAEPEPGKQEAERKQKTGKTERTNQKQATDEKNGPNQKQANHLPGAILVILTFLVVSLLWLPFRAQNMSELGGMTVQLFSAGGWTGQTVSGLWSILGLKWYEMSLLIALLAALKFVDREETVQRLLKPAVMVAVIALIIAVRLMHLAAYGETAFLYFQF